MPEATAVARTRSAPSPLRVSTKRRYQDSRRAVETDRSRGVRGKRGGRPLVSRETKTSPWTRASGRSTGSSAGSTLAMAVSTVSPAPHPAERLARPKATPVAQGGGGAVDRAEDVDEPQHRFGQHQGQALLEPFLEPAKVVSGRVGDRPEDHDHVVAVELDVVGPDVVGEGIEGPSGGQVEAGVVPMTGEEPVLDAASMEREAHVRAPVVDGEGLAVAVEDADRLGADLAGQAALGPELVCGPDPGSLHGHAFHVGHLNPVHVDLDFRPKNQEVEHTVEVKGLRAPRPVRPAESGKRSTWLCDPRRMSAARTSCLLGWPWQQDGPDPQRATLCRPQPPALRTDLRAGPWWFEASGVKRAGFRSGKELHMTTAIVWRPEVLDFRSESRFVFDRAGPLPSSTTRSRAA